MAGRPCSICNQRYVGPSSALYIHVRGNGQEYDAAHKLCPVHYGEIRRAYVEVDGVFGLNDAEPLRNQHCLFCDEEHSPQSCHAVYATGFPAKADREDFYGVVGNRCILDLVDRWGLA